MDREENLLMTLEKIQLNNRITYLEHSMDEQEKVNNMLSIKSKELVMELLDQKNTLEAKINELSSENAQLHNIIDTVPPFIVKFFSRKKRGMLDEK